MYDMSIVIAHINFFFSVEYRLPAGLAISARKVSKSGTILVGVAKPVQASIKYAVDWERCKSAVVNLQRQGLQVGVMFYC